MINTSSLKRKAIGVVADSQVVLWMALNLLDLGLSLVGLEYGRAKELLMLACLLQKAPRTAIYYQASYIGYGLYKMGLAVGVPFLLARLKKPYLLKWLNGCLVCICLYLVIMLVKTFS